MAVAEAYLHAKFHLDLSNRLASIHQRHKQTDSTDRTEEVRQRSDSIEQTVLQTVVQNLDASGYISVAESLYTVSSTTSTQCAPKAADFGEITQNKDHDAGQGHSRSPISIPIESSYTIPISDYGRPM